MRRILLEYARRRSAAKRVIPDAEKPGTLGRVGGWEEILAVDNALSRLSEFAPQQARIAEMRYFGGLSVDEAAEALSVSSRTVKREWELAKGWLHAELSAGGLQ